MNRREFLQCAALIAAGTATAPAAWSMSQEQKGFLAAQANYIDRSLPKYFTSEQRTVVTAIAERILPATDTPGATDAGVPRFIELMVADWFNEEERALFMAGLLDLQQRAGGDFSALPASEQTQMLELLEQEASDASWYSLGNVMRIWDSTAPFICQFKELTVLGFMLSEVAGTRFQRQNPMGTFNGNVPLEGKPGYGAELPLRMMSETVEL